MLLKAIIISVLLSVASAKETLVTTSHPGNVEKYKATGCEDLSDGLADNVNILKCNDLVNLLDQDDIQEENKIYSLSPIESPEHKSTATPPRNPFKLESDDGKGKNGKGKSEQAVPWGLDRTNQKYFMTDGYAGTGSFTGEGTHVYVIDTGIDLHHEDFEGRIEMLADTAPPEPNSKNDDNTINPYCNFHGTHVAGTIMSKSYGFATKAKAYSVRVLNCRGRGTQASVIAGINAVVKHVMSKGDAHAKKSVINMSLGAPFEDPIVASVIKEATDAGIHFVVAAGNDNIDACKTSPTDAPSTISVGAIGFQDKTAEFSNHGSCVDIMAPGVDIESTVGGPRGSSGSTTMSGTSMAAPHVAGVVALLLAKNAYTIEGMKAKLSELSAKDLVTHLLAGTPNKILQAPFDAEEKDVRELTESLHALAPDTMDLLDSLRVSVLSLGEARKTGNLGSRQVRKSIEKEIKILRSALSVLSKKAHRVSRNVKHFN